MSPPEPIDSASEPKPEVEDNGEDFIHVGIAPRVVAAIPRVHSLYECPRCSESFSAASDLRTHVKAHAPPLPTTALDSTLRHTLSKISARPPCPSQAVKRPLENPETPPGKRLRSSSPPPAAHEKNPASTSSPAPLSSPVLRSQADYDTDDEPSEPLFSDPLYDIDEPICTRPSPITPLTLPLHVEDTDDTSCDPCDSALSPITFELPDETDDSSCTRPPPFTSIPLPIRLPDTNTATTAATDDLECDPSIDDLPTPSSPAAELPVEPHSPQAVEASKYLSRIGYFVHHPVRVLVCTSCSNSVELENAHSHKAKASSTCQLSNPRSISRLDLERNLQLAGASDTLVFPPNHGPIPPIPGIPIQEGWICTCDPLAPCYGQPLASETSRKRHFKNHHPNITAKESHKFYQKSPLQSLYAFAARRVCIATLATDPVAAPPRYENFISTFTDRLPVPASKPTPLLTKPTVFETYTQWHVELDGTDVKQLYEHARRPDAQDPQLQRLRSGITSYFRNVVPDTLRSGHRHLLCRIHSPEPLVLNHQPFCVPQNPATLTSYSNIFSSFILMMAKCASDPIPGYSMHTTTAQNNAISQALANLDNTTMSDRERHEQIHELCWLSLSEQPQNAYKNERATPILRFLIAYHLADDGHDHFQPPRYVSHALSAIQWCWQAVGYCRCTLFASKYPEGAMGAYEAIVKPYLQELGHSPFTTLRSIIHLTASLAHNSSTLPRFVMATTRDHFSIDGHPITFKRFREYCLELVSTAESRLTTVLRGCSLGDADETITNALRVGQTSNIFYDRLRDVGAGYSFLSDTKNPLAAGKSLLIQHFLRDGCQDFSVPTPGGAYPEAFRPLQCSIWLSEVDRLVEALYAATVATWPGAGRGTELDHLTYNNQHGQRHLFMINNILTFVTSYSKTQKMTGKAPLIPRGLDSRLARVFIITLNYVYYAAQVITHQLGDDTSSSAYSKYIFVRRGTPLNTEAMTQILRSFTNEHFLCQFGVRDWRHLMKFVLRHMVDITLDQDDDEEQDGDNAPINALFGHGQRIANTVYGIEADSLTDLSQPDVARAHRYGIVYQKALGLWADFSLDSLGIPSEEKPPASNLSSVAISPLDAVSRRQIGTELEQVLNTRLPALADQMMSTLSRALYYHIPNLSTSFHPLLPSSTTVNVHPSRLECLQRLFRSKSFKSPEQATIFEYVLQNLRSVFGILGTGGGKSLMFYGPPLVEPNGITVVVSPFVSLAEEQFATAEMHSIPVSMWPNDSIDFDTVRLIIVPAHEAGTELFVKFIKATIRINKLRRVIYDEAHQILMSGYRNCYDNVSRVAGQGVPLHFLSATLLPQSVAAIAHSAKLPPDTYCVIRASTVRPNLRYVVEDFSDDKDRQRVMERIASICRRVSSQLEERERILIYCSSYDECDAVKKLLGYPVYKSQLEEGLDPATNAKRRKVISDNWRAGNPRQLIATTGFGNGIDHAHVRLVVTLNPYNASDAVQQTGRAGRDDAKATCYIFNTRRHTVSAPGEDDHGGVGLMRMLYTTNDCVRICFGNFDDRAYSCIAHGSADAVLCSRCEKLESRTSVMLTPASIGGLSVPLSTSSSRPDRTSAADSSPLQAPPPSRQTRTSAVDSSPLQAPPPSRQTRTSAADSSPLQAPPPLPETRTPAVDSSPLRTPFSSSPIAPHFSGQSAPLSTRMTAFTPPHNVPKRPAASKNPRQRHDPPASKYPTPPSIVRPRKLGPVTTPTPASSSGQSHAHPTPESPLRVPIYPHDGFRSRRFSQRSSLLPASLSSLSFCSTQVLEQPSSPPSPTLLFKPRPTTEHVIARGRLTVSALPPCPPIPPTLAKPKIAEPVARTTNSVVGSRQAALEARLALQTTRASYLAYIPKFFELTQTGCIMCLLLCHPYQTCNAVTFVQGPNPQVIYKPYNCSQGLINSSQNRHTIPSFGNAGSAYKSHFRNSLTFQPQYKICYRCIRPTDEDAFPHPIGDADCLAHDDVIKPFLWAIFCMPIASMSPDQGEEWREILFQEVSAPRSATPLAYAAWAQHVEDPDGINICNGLRLIIAWTRMVYTNQWPLPFNGM
ncbi:hypothetical protein EYR40_002169 [Pleurotus pulmonarius]|nr:hypothetical protein EYR36_002340 [Pleurotus pulmonarius]KAF4583678.1 hypothetical protein EYR40_002169 [Pleurotus pulmonarius]